MRVTTLVPISLPGILDTVLPVTVDMQGPDRALVAVHTAELQDALRGHLLALADHVAELEEDVRTLHQELGERDAEDGLAEDGCPGCDACQPGLPEDYQTEAEAALERLLRDIREA